VPVVSARRHRTHDDAPSRAASCPPPATGSGAPQPGGPPDPRRALGRRGEQLAAEHLLRLGYELLARNVRTRHGEIDIIARDRAVLVFVEVKTRCRRSRSGAVEPLGGVRPLQRLRLRRLASAWLADSEARSRAGGRGFKTIRFDAVGVVVDRDSRLLRLDHVEAAW
jgi:putative endonuclease